MKSADRRKQCRTCGEVKSVRNFYRHPTYADGYMNHCRKCRIKATTENVEAKREHYREYKRQWAARPENVAKRKAYAQSERGRAVHRECCRIYNAFKRLTA